MRMIFNPIGPQSRRPRREPRKPTNMTALDPNKTRVRDTLRRTNDPFSGTRLETWYAESADNVWSYERLEIPGTPWVTFHNPTNVECGYHGSLDAAREATALGISAANLQRILDERKAAS